MNKNAHFSKPSEIGVSHCMWYLQGKGLRVIKYDSRMAAALGGCQTARYFVDGRYLNAAALRKMVFDMMGEE
jgi:hypothetical protein